MNNSLIQKAINSRNEQAIKKLVNIEAEKDLANTTRPTLPSYQKPVVERDKTGWKIFCYLIKQLNP